MELGLSLGEAPARPFAAAEKAAMSATNAAKGFGLGLGVGFGRTEEEEDEEEEEEEEESEGGRSSTEPSLQLNLLPLLPGPRRSSSPPGRRGFPWSSLETNRNFEATTRGFDVNRPPAADEIDEGAATTAAAAAAAAAAAGSSSPNSTLSSFQMDFSVHRGGGAGERGATGSGALVVVAVAGDGERPASSRGSDEEDNGAARKKLRLSKEQSAFLEESFKEHNTLNPKQKLALAKQLNLRPRQVEVWFQNRRARTKLKQTEVDCEYLKRCCETLTEENRRLQKELAELRALKTTNPFYMHLPATTLSMCPSCERVATTTTSAPSAAAAIPSPAALATTTSTSTAAPAPVPASSGDHRPSSFAALLSRPRLFPFVTQQTPPPTTTS